MKNIVYSITEAFSQQPSSMCVGSNSYPSGIKISRIVKEKINFPVAGDPFEHDYYVGYSEEGKRLFEYRAETVNVHYI